MDKEEILKEIEKTKEHLSNMEQMLRRYRCERWKPELNEEYYYVNQVGAIFRAVNDEFDINAVRYRTYNCFQTREQAEAEAEKILVRRMLEDIARRLNKGQKIDWNDKEQTKSFIFLDCKTQLIERDCSFRHKNQGVVYCLDRNFKDVAIEEIGEKRLKKYLRCE